MTHEGGSVLKRDEEAEHEWSHDPVLSMLQELQDPVGSLVRAFPGRARLAEDPDWLKRWFVDLATRFSVGCGPDLNNIVAAAAEEGEFPFLSQRSVRSTIRLISLRPQWFRGFRNLPAAITFDADLVVLEGRNSSGKTSISEAIEWVLTGDLSRRTSGEQGHPSELADCIANEFRPEDETTSVELTLTVDGVDLLLRRVLTKDYSTVAADDPKSTLSVNGTVVTKPSERKLFDKLFAGIHPILMQHNLHRFVHDDPSSRRTYFEQLLQIDELTALIEKAVIGTNQLTEIVNPVGGTGLAALRDLAREFHNVGGDQAVSAAKKLKKMEALQPDQVPAVMETEFPFLGDEFFAEAVRGAVGLPEYKERIENTQRRQRESRLPLLATLQLPKDRSVPDAGPLRVAAATFAEALRRVAAAKQAAGEIDDAQRKLAGALDQLIEAQLIDPLTEDDQQCPVCEDGMLPADRVRTISSWAPLSRAVEEAAKKKVTALAAVQRELETLKTSVGSVVPSQVGGDDAEAQLTAIPERAKDLARQALHTMAAVRADAAKLKSTLQGAIDTLEATTPDDISAQLDNELTALKEHLETHRQGMIALEEVVGAISRDDISYRLREKWLSALNMTAAISEDIGWERAKSLACTALSELREALIQLRTDVVEDTRRDLSDGMTDVWNLLREDSGASFSRIYVPPARGKGYKLDFELKAVISDGTVETEVDALRVFSESQVNAVGIAAYITRAKRLGHQLLIFDDPVQSMDEEHFRSFAAELLPAVIDAGHQVVILTHSYTFDERVHEHHYSRNSYATMKTRYSKRKGCCVDEGNRRVSERLKRAEHEAEDGNLADAWILVRRALERMYLLVKVKADASFRSAMWRNHTAESMWNEGVGELIGEQVPGSAKRLKEILDYTVLGAHDKTATSETDLKAAVRDLRALLNPLRLGGG